MGAHGGTMGDLTTSDGAASEPTPEQVLWLMSFGLAHQDVARAWWDAGIRCQEHFDVLHDRRVRVDEWRQFSEFLTRIGVDDIDLRLRLGAAVRSEAAYLSILHYGFTDPVDIARIAESPAQHHLRTLIDELGVKTVDDLIEVTTTIPSKDLDRYRYEGVRGARALLARHRRGEPSRSPLPAVRRWQRKRTPLHATKKRAVAKKMARQTVADRWGEAHGLNPTAARERAAFEIGLARLPAGEANRWWDAGFVDAKEVLRLHRCGLTPDAVAWFVSQGVTQPSDQRRYATAGLNATTIEEYRALGFDDLPTMCDLIDRGVLPDAAAGFIHQHITDVHAMGILTHWRVTAEVAQGFIRVGVTDPVEIGSLHHLGLTPAMAAQMGSERRHRVVNCEELLDPDSEP